MGLKAKYKDDGTGAGPDAVATSDGATLIKGGDAVEVSEAGAAELQASSVGSNIEISGKADAEPGVPPAEDTPPAEPAPAEASAPASEPTRRK